MNTTVSITRRVNKKYYPIVENANGSIKPNVVKVGGVETYLTGGNFYINWTQNGKVHRQSVGAEAGQARNRRDKKAKELAAIAQGTSAGLTLVATTSAAPAEQLLSASANIWLTEIAIHKDSKTYAAYKVAVRYFLESCIKQTVDTVTRQDMLNFITSLRDRGLSDRTVSNKFIAVVGWLESFGAKLELKTHDRPKYVQEIVEVYEQDELDALYAASTSEEAFMWKFALMTGMRDSELMHVEWKDFNESKKMVTVRTKPQWDFKPKAGKERHIPVPPPLMSEMAKRKSTGLIFPNDSGKPNDHMYRQLQAVAEKAGVSGAYLHKFRQTYGTRCHDAKVPTRTIMAWMGHSSMSATLRYLREATGEAEQALSNGVWA